MPHPDVREVSNATPQQPLGDSGLLVGAFLFEQTWKQWGHGEAECFLRSLTHFGVNAIFTEAELYRDDVIDIAHRLGLKWFGALSCFSNHASGNRLVKERVELWPIDQMGNKRAQMEWYVGVTPTFDDHRSERLSALERVTRAHDLDGLFLDFVRWPLHWELELRPGARPLQSSFDPHTLDRFSKETGIELATPGDVAACARLILEHHFPQWVDFKCEVITSFVRSAREAVGDIPLGVFLVPLPQTRAEAFVGQRLSDLAPLVDHVSPMAYHAVVHRPVSWVTKVVRDACAIAPGKVLPVVQVDSSEGPEVGADWGPPILAEQFEHAVGAALEVESAQGVVAFTATALFRDGRGERLRRTLSEHV